MFVPECLLRLHGVGGNAEHRGPGLGECVLEPGEVDRLFGAAGRVCTRVEEQDELFPRIIGQRDGIAAVPRQMEGGRFCSFRQGGFRRTCRGGF